MLELDENIICCFGANRHVCENPIVLTCRPDEKGALKVACLRCIEYQLDYTGKFKCLLCDDEHKIENVVANSQSLTAEMDMFRSHFNDNLKNTIQMMLTKANKIDQSIKEKYSPSNRVYVMENVFEFLEENIVIRVESLKSDLEKLGHKLTKRINKFKLEKKNFFTNIHGELDVMLMSYNQTKAAAYTNTTNRVDALEKFKSIESLLSKLTYFKNACNNECTVEHVEDKNRQTTSRFLNKCDQVRFKSTCKSSALPNATVIGYLSGFSNLKFLRANLPREPYVETIFLGGFLRSCCGLAELFGQKNQLIVTDFSAFNIVLMNKYDSYMTTEIEINSIDMFRLVKYKNFYAVCTDCDEASLFNDNDREKFSHLYVCDMDLNRVLIYDLNIAKLKRIIIGTGGQQSQEFECPSDISYYGGKLFVLDRVKCSVDIFTRHGDFVESFLFNDVYLQENNKRFIDSPLSVRANLNTLAIIDWKKSVYLFDGEFKFKHRIEYGYLMSMCLVSDNLTLGSVKLLIHSQDGCITAYSLFNRENQNDGEQVEVLKPVQVFKRTFKELKCRSEFMIYSLSYNSLILSLGWAKSIALVRF